MKKIVYIIPGYGESHTRQKGYDRVGRFFKERGIAPIYIEIPWHIKKPHQFEYWTAQFLKKYKKPKGVKVYMLGFSFGAVIALLAEPKAKPNTLILCSLSPYFIEDHPKLPKSWLEWYRKNMKGSDYHFGDLTFPVRARTLLLMGDKEPLVVGRRMRAARRMIKKSSLFIAKGATHAIGQKEYLATIARAVVKLQ
jgi:pimeloyl-ACP methyl ester carboxylesterase